MSAKEIGSLLGMLGISRSQCFLNQARIGDYTTKNYMICCDEIRPEYNELLSGTKLGILHHTNFLLSKRQK
jgi:hypothetical protein